MSVNREQQALMRAAREVLRELVRESPYTSTYIADTIGIHKSNLSHWLVGKRQGFQNLDTSLVVSILSIIGVSYSEYARRAEARAAEILAQEPPE